LGDTLLFLFALGFGKFTGLSVIQNHEGCSCLSQSPSSTAGHCVHLIEMRTRLTNG
jgi:hypothetical protein